MIPAIDLLGGRPVFLRGGEPDTATIVSADPVSLARSWQDAGARRLHLVDLDAAFGRGDNGRLVRTILRSVAIPVQVGGGLRDEGAIRDLLGNGAAAVVVGTRALEEPDWLRTVAVRFPSRILLALDRDPRGALVDGWRRVSRRAPGESLGIANGVPLAGVLFTNVSAEGRLRGVGDPRDALVRRCRHPRIAAGGVTTLRDVVALRRAGYDHVIVGKAFHAGTLDFARAEEAMG